MLAAELLAEPGADRPRTLTGLPEVDERELAGLGPKERAALVDRSSANPSCSSRGTSAASTASPS